MPSVLGSLNLCHQLTALHAANCSILHLSTLKSFPWIILPASRQYALCRKQGQAKQVLKASNNLSGARDFFIRDGRELGNIGLHDVGSRISSALRPGLATTSHRPKQSR